MSVPRIPGAIAQFADADALSAQQLPNQTSESGACIGDLVLQHLNARGFVPFHPTLAQHLGYKAALFLGLSLYWTRHAARLNPQRQGWFHLSAREIEEATTLSRREQETVRDMLVRAGLIEQHLAGRPAVMHFRINLRRLANRLEVIDGGAASVESAWAWFEKSISFYRPLGDLAGGAGGGLYLSFVLRRQRRAVLTPGGGSDQVQIRTDEIERILSLTPKIQRTIRERLKRTGLITVTPASRSGILVHVNLPAVLACVRGQAIAPLPAAGGAKSGNSRTGTRLPSRSHIIAPTAAGTLIQQPDLMLASGRGVQPGQASGLASAFRFQPMQALVLAEGVAGVAGTAQLPLPARAGLLPGGGSVIGHSFETASGAQSAKLERGSQGPKRQTGSAQNAKLGVPKAPSYIQTGFTNTTTTTAPAGEPESGDPAGCRRGVSLSTSSEADQLASWAALIYPTSLSAATLPGLRDVLAQAPVHLRQLLLDELQGQLQIPAKTIHNPAGWLLGLIRRCGDGQGLALAQQVAKDRQQRAAAQRQLAAAHSAPRADLVKNPEVRQEERQKLMALRGDFARRAGRR